MTLVIYPRTNNPRLAQATVSWLYLPLNQSPQNHRRKEVRERRPEAQEWLNLSWRQKRATKHTGLSGRMPGIDYCGNDSCPAPAPILSLLRDEVGLSCFMPGLCLYSLGSKYRAVLPHHRPQPRKPAQSVGWVPPILLTDLAPDNSGPGECAAFGSPRASPRPLFPA